MLRLPNHTRDNRVYGSGSTGSALNRTAQIIRDDNAMNRWPLTTAPETAILK